MYAIIDDRGRQFKVEEGQELEIDLLDASAGDKHTFERVLVVGDGQATQIGTPAVTGASVTAEILGVEQGPKLTVQKARRRKNSRRRTGHRQLNTRVRIEKIVGA